MSEEHQQGTDRQAGVAEPGKPAELDREPECSNSPSASLGSVARADGGVLQAVAAEAPAISTQSQGIKVPRREDSLGSPVPTRRRRGMRRGVIAAGLLTILGLGWVGGMNTQRIIDLDLPGQAVALVSVVADQTWTWLQATADSIRSNGKAVATGSTTEGSDVTTAAAEPNSPQGELRRLDGQSSPDRRIADLDIKVDQVRAASDEAARDLATRLDQFRDRTEQKSTELTAKLAQIEEQLGHLEHQLQASSALAKAAQPGTTTLTSPVAAPVPGPAAAAEKSAPKLPSSEVKAAEPKLIKNWRVREVLDGVAILEGPKGFIQVQRGDRVPAVGPVEAIQRRGKGWAVVTSNGVITTN